MIEDIEGIKHVDPLLDKKPPKGYLEAAIAATTGLMAGVAIWYILKPRGSIYFKPSTCKKNPLYNDNLLGI